MKQILYRVHAITTKIKYLDVIKIDDNDIYELIEEMHRKDKFDKELDIGLTFECGYD